MKTLTATHQHTDETELFFFVNAERFYRRQVDTYRLLDDEETQHLGYLIWYGRHLKDTQKPPWSTNDLQAIREGEQAQQRMIEANLRLVYLHAQRYRRYAKDFMELLQEGNLGLMAAARKFDYRRGVTFASYANRWIRSYMLECIKTQKYALHTPLHKIEEAQKLERTARTLAEQSAGDVHDDEEQLAQAMEMSLAQIRMLKTIPVNTVSLDAERSDDESGITLQSILEDDPQQAPEALTMQQTLQKHVRALLETTLDARERTAIQLRFGFRMYRPTTLTQLLSSDFVEVDDERDHSLPEIGQRIDLSHEATRQLLFRALTKLRDAVQHQPELHDFLVG